ncbi:phosphoribosyltransferase-like protein [Hoeflea sp.]|uniref:phosphoribosyltransferase-like protein n=1 Tax=Hoeflea sp. TaxID=1940281 RepID=UPI003BB1252D
MTPAGVGRQFYTYLALELDPFLPRTGPVQLVVGGQSGFPDEDVIMLAEALIGNGQREAGPIAHVVVSDSTTELELGAGGKVADFRNNRNLPSINESILSRTDVVFLTAANQERIKCQTITFDRDGGLAFKAVTTAFTKLLRELGYRSQAIEMPARYLFKGFNAVLREFGLVENAAPSSIGLQNLAAVVAANWHYVDQQVRPEQIVNWVNQFPDASRDGAIDVLKYLNSTGFYSRTEIALILSRLREEHAAHARMVTIQPPRKSESMLLYEMRLQEDADPISEVFASSADELVCVDDVIGSGDTIIECLFRHGQPIHDWLSQSGKSIKVIASFASAEGVERIHTDPRCQGKIHVFAAKVMSSDDGIFSPDCKVFRSTEVANQFRADCERIGESIFWGSPFGWGDCAWAVVTGYNVPDCSLPVIWGDCSAPPWVPLFARR